MAKHGMGEGMMDENMAKHMDTGKKRNGKGRRRKGKRKGRNPFSGMGRG